MHFIKHILAVIGISLIMTTSLTAFAQTQDDTLVVVFGTDQSQLDIDTEKTDAYIRETDTYYIRANHYYAILKSIVPYFTREISGDVTYPAVCDEYLTDMVRALNTEIPSGFALYNSESTNYPYQNLKPIYTTVNEEYYEYGLPGGKYNYVLFVATEAGVNVDPSMFSNGGSGFFGESAIKVSAFDTYADYERVYRPMNTVDLEDYDFSDETDAFVAIPSKYIHYFDSISPAVTAYKTGEETFTLNSGVNVVKFTYPTPWGEDLVWYEIFLGIGDAPSNVDLPTADDGYNPPHSSLDDAKAEVGGLVMILIMAAGLIIYIRHKIALNKEEKEDFDRDMEKINTKTESHTHTEDEFEGLNVIDVEGRVIYESPENKAKREAEERASTLGLPLHKEG